LTPTPALANAIHIGDLDGEATMPSSQVWRAVATIRIHDASHQPVGGIAVLAAWSDGSSASCTTGTTGACSVSRNLSPASNPSITFTVDRIARKGYTYDTAANHDPDGDSDGTRIIIARP